MSSRIAVQKTFKIYVDGKFPRTESGRYYKATNKKGEELGNICLSSRKDFRNAVVAARKAQPAWSGRSAYNIGQILYRIAENLESRKEEFIGLIKKEESCSEKKAKTEIENSIDTLIYYAGWSDKYQQIFSNVNPVASSHFNFSIQEAVGVVSVMVSESTQFIDFISAISSIICGGNTTIILAKENAPLSAVSFAEILQHSDVPNGVINILTGKSEELQEHFSSHMDVNSLLLIGEGFNLKHLQKLASNNVKRLRVWPSSQKASPYLIKDFLETKTTWHPIEQIGGASPGY